jgi:hypothetical protein
MSGPYLSYYDTFDVELGTHMCHIKSCQGRFDIYCYKLSGQVECGASGTRDPPRTACVSSDNAPPNVVLRMPTCRTGPEFAESFLLP